MAGLGRKVFTRERATVADVQGYLMDQVIMRFASASAANSAIPSPSEAMHRYLDDVNRLEFYTGASWVPVIGREITRDHTPVSSFIPSGSFRESAVNDGPTIPSFTTYGSRRLVVIGTFRVGTQVAGTGAALPSMKIDGATICDGVARWTDSTMTLHGVATVNAGSHTIGARVDAFGGAVTWVSAKITIIEGAVE